MKNSLLVMVSRVMAQSFHEEFLDCAHATSSYLCFAAEYELLGLLLTTRKKKEVSGCINEAAAIFSH